MKKYLKITFIFIMIFSMFVKSGYSSDYIIFNGEKLNKKASVLAQAILESENEPETVEGEWAAGILKNRLKNPEYTPYFAQGLQLAKFKSLSVEQPDTLRKIEYLEMKYYSSKK